MFQEYYANKQKNMSLLFLSPNHPSYYRTGQFTLDQFGQIWIILTGGKHVQSIVINTADFTNSTYQYDQYGQ